MPTCLFIRGVPGVGKITVARLLERDLKWPVIWVHLLDPIYKTIGQYKCPALTDKLIRAVAWEVMGSGRDLIVVRPSRQVNGVHELHHDAMSWGHKFIPVKLTAAYPVLVTRVTRRWTESPYRLTTREALDEYLADRAEESFPGEFEVKTDHMTPEQVAGRVKELLP